MRHYKEPLLVQHVTRCSICSTVQ